MAFSINVAIGIFIFAMESYRGICLGLTNAAISRKKNKIK